MSIKEIHSNEYSTYFCTFTCHDWIPLYEITNSYDIVYQWFEMLKQQSVDVLGYVIMPNHLHCILHFNKENFSLNKTIGNAKRFMAYEIVNRLEKGNNIKLLKKLSDGCTERDKKKGQLHKIFKQSFDAKAIFSDQFMEQKLNYMHANPITGKWTLVADYTDYEHSSASFYELGIIKHFTPKHFKDL
jgi:REP element-mobilizing transposase RayT